MKIYPAPAAASLSLLLCASLSAQALRHTASPPKHAAPVKATSAEAVTSYLNAIYARSIPGVEKALKLGVPVDSEDQSGMTALERAASFGDAAIVKLLLDHGADANHMDQYMLSPLTYAARSGNVETLQLLIDHHAALDAPTLQTPLEMAAQSKMVDAARFLLDHGAPVDGHSHVMYPMDTPLILAVSNQDLAMVKLLVEHGADVVGGKGSYTVPLAHCIGHSDEPDSPELSAVARYLIEKGADVNSRIGADDTILMEAASHGITHLTETLVACGADVNVADRRGETAVMKAIALEEAGFSPVTKPVGLSKFLLAHGADPRQAANAHLVIAARRIDLAGVKKALADGADAGGASLAGESALVALCKAMLGGNVAQYKDAVSIVKALVAAGAKVSAPDKNGTTPITITTNEKFAGYLASLGADPKQTIVARMMQSLSISMVDEAGRMLKPGLPVNTFNGDGRTPLMLTAAINDPKAFALAKRLVDLGADVKAKDPQGNTALHLAVLPEVASLLLAHGADINARNNQNDTPLISAVGTTGIPGEAVALVLLKAGADPSLKNEYDKTALDYAKMLSPAYAQKLEAQIHAAKQ